jgi:hypothetical protein
VFQLIVQERLALLLSLLQPETQFASLTQILVTKSIFALVQLVSHHSSLITSSHQKPQHSAALVHGLLVHQEVLVR